MTRSLPIHEWKDADGVLLGCGTEAELQDLKRQGVVAERAQLASVIGHEPVLTAGQRLVRERNSRIEFARMAAADGCEASARELEELLAEDGADREDLTPLSIVNEYVRRAA